MQAVYRSSSCMLRLLPAVRARFYSKGVPQPPPAEEASGLASGSVPQWEERVVAGLQPSGALHVGNYFGCVRRLVRLQAEGRRTVVFIADLHALTGGGVGGAVGGAGGDLRSRTRSLAAQLLAAGLAAGRGSGRALVFAQSAVSRHAELCWLLACLCSAARLQALPQFRERAAAGREALAAMLYPVLQAADILIYRGTLVPVGADQQRHVQLAAALVKTFHHRHGGHVFPAPRPLLPEQGAERILNLRDPTKKMSKSDPNSKSRILLTDDEATIKLKIRKAVTDFEPRVTHEPESRPGVSNLVHLHCLAADLAPEEAVAQSDALTTAQYKSVVSEALCNALRGVRQGVEEFERKPRIISSVLEDGAARAQELADQTYEAVAARVGLTSYRPWLGDRHTREQ